MPSYLKILFTFSSEDMSRPFESYTHTSSRTRSSTCNVNITTPERIWCHTIIGFSWWLIVWIPSISSFIIRIINKVYMTFKLIDVDFIKLTLSYYIRIVAILRAYKSMYMARFSTTNLIFLHANHLDRNDPKNHNHQGIH